MIGFGGIDLHVHVRCWGVLVLCCVLVFLLCLFFVVFVVRVMLVFVFEVIVVVWCLVCLCVV